MTASIRRALAVILAIAASIGAFEIHGRAQTITAWQFEKVAPFQARQPGCTDLMTLAGFDHDPQGRPVVAWREENGCGGSPDVFWSRKDGGVWNLNQFFSARRYDGTAKDGYFHQMILRPSDGNPFLVYRDVAPGNYLNTYEADLGAFPNGDGSVFLESLVGPQTCAYMTYALAFAPHALVPDWATVFIGCNQYGDIRLDGTTVGGTSPAGPSLAVTPDGTRHMLWTDGPNALYYGSVGPTVLFSHGNLAGGETAIVADANGYLHGIVRGIDSDADWDLGAMVYIKSTDNGQTWRPFEYVDPDDDAAPGSIGANSDISLAVDSHGIPAVTYWRSRQELWYARRDGPDDTWTKSLVTTMPYTGNRYTARLDFDPNDQPVIAYFDEAAEAIQLARPLAAGTTLPIDISVSGSAAPSPVQPGGDVYYALTVTNHGDANVDHVVLANQLPPGATFLDASPYSDASQRWPIGTLSAHGSTTITVHAKAPNAAGDMVDIASVTSDGPDTAPGNNVVAIGATVCAGACSGPLTNGLDVAASVSVMPNPVMVNGALTFVARVTNVGSVDAAGVTLVNTLPSGASLVDVVPAASSLAGGDQTFSVGALPVGASAFFVIHADAPLSTGEIVDHVHVSASADVNAANDTASATTTVKADACFVQPSGLVAHWRADGNALDEVGGHNGDMQGSRTFVPGHAGQAFSFDGANDSVSIPNAPELTSNTFTVSAWVYPTSLRNSGWNVVASGGASMWLGFTRGQPILYAQQFNEYTLSPTAIPVNQWYLLTGTFDGAVARLYVNGVEVAETADSGPMNFDSTTPFGIGTYYYQGQVYTPEAFDGLIDEVSMHNRALSAEEVQNLYDGSSTTLPNCNALPPPPPPPPPPPASTPIRNGDPETAPQFNGVGMILASPTHAACTATLVGRSVVLTTAVCLQDDSPAPVFAFSLGGGRTARLTDIRQHPLFNTVEGMDRTHDVALAKLDESVANGWTDIVLPALSDSAPALPLNATAVGFGQIDAVSGAAIRTSGALLATEYAPDFDIDFNVVPQAYIEVEPGNARSQMFCPAGVGGPLFVQDQIAGVASFRNVTTCADPGSGYYLNLNANGLADWIHTTLGELTTVVDTTPPVLTVPVNITRPATTNAGARVSFSATAIDSIDPAPLVTCAPASGSLFAVGRTTVSCTAADHAGNVSAPKTFVVTVTPKNPKPPKVTAPANIRVEATGPGGTRVTFVATATDPFDGTLPVTCLPASGSMFPLGDTTVACSATNSSGRSDVDTFVVRVRDTTDPDIVSVTPSVTRLPNTDTIVPVTIAVVATDLVDTAPACRITRVAGEGLDLDHNGVVDWRITGALTLNVEAVARRRADRTYTVTVRCTDDSGNSSKERTAIVVAHRP